MEITTTTTTKQKQISSKESLSAIASGSTRLRTTRIAGGFEDLPTRSQGHETAPRSHDPKNRLMPSWDRANLKNIRSIIIIIIISSSSGGSRNPECCFDLPLL